MSDDGEKGLSAFGGQILRGAVVDMVSKALSWAVLAVAALLALLIWQGGTVPAWIAALVVMLTLAITLRFHLQVRALRAQTTNQQQRIEELEPLELTRGDLEDEIADLWGGIERHNLYSAHVAKMLDQLQRVVARDITVPISAYVERGILQPARDLLTLSEPGAEVRLSILMPSDERWNMIFSAGHSIEGQNKYNERIADTLSRLPFESGKVFAWDDVVDDDRFQPNPRAGREIHAMVSLPLGMGDSVFGVLNAVASLPDVFDTVEIHYLESVASVISVAVGVDLQDQRSAADAPT
jgi:hypothetical protein